MVACTILNLLHRVCFNRDTFIPCINISYHRSNLLFHQVVYMLLNYQPIDSRNILYDQLLTRSIKYTKLSYKKHKSEPVLDTRRMH